MNDPKNDITIQKIHLHKGGEWEREIYKGRTHGYDRQWNVDGVLVKESYYWRNHLIGPSKEWFDNGNLKSESHSEGGVGNYNEWNIDGILIRSFMGTRLQRTDTEWHPNSQMKKEIQVDYIERYMTTKVWDENGILLESDHKELPDFSISPDWELIEEYKYFEPNGKTNEEIEHVIAQFKRDAFLVKEDTKITRMDGFKTSVLGNVNIKAANETWPVCNGVTLNPIIQISVSDLPYRPKVFDNIDYFCVYAHPTEPWEITYGDGLVIRTYKTGEEIEFILAPECIKQDVEPKSLTFELCDDYPGYDLPVGLKEYLEDNYPDRYENEAQQLVNLFGTKILGWPGWVQDSQFPEDSVFVMGLNLYCLCEHDADLYIFQNIQSKEFHGFVQMT